MKIEKEKPKVRKEFYRDMLTPLQYNVAFEHGTETAFDNAYHDHKEEGLYESIASGETLFSSKDKYDSGSGWPSFTKPVVGAPISYKVDSTGGMTRTEVSCTSDEVHLGHVFEDGPKELGGKRYCINSACLEFVPRKNLS